MANFKVLIERVVSGETDAWRELQVALEPLIESITRSHPDLRSKGLARLPDDVAEVKVAVLERLARSNFQNLRRFLERVENQSDESERFEAWVYGAVDFVVREHLRKRFGRAPTSEKLLEGAVLPSKRELQSQAARLDDEDVARSFVQTLTMTTRLTAGQILSHIEQNFTAEEVLALRLYYFEDRDWSELAAELGLADDASAKRLVRRLNERLRYHFVKSAQDNG